ncbi:hypothetical protein EDB81DRAFT_135939 [Dactylonectria macrodidyma]|uniref:Chromo domain-containing protein n=1 Tax=Dactylonectria macrodidyma TaxID=307937 RepID=A0A9P9E5L6_9HYPO|nr:hypothetical protein EDB81DRAFT_135939 [Dactylonectria macrodidyma]
MASNPRAHSVRMTEHDSHDMEALDHGRTELVSANDNQQDHRRNLHKKHQLLVKQRQQRKNMHRLKIRQEKKARIVDNPVREWEFSGIQAVEKALDGSLLYLIEWEPTWGTISDLSGPAAMEIAKEAVVEAFGTQAWEVDQTSFQKDK